MSFGVHNRRAGSTTDLSDVLTHIRLVWCVDTHQTGLMCWHHSLSLTHTNTHTLYQRSSILIQCVLHCVSVCVCARARKREREMSGANLRIGKFSKASAGLLISIFYVSVTQVLRSIRKQPCGEQNFVSSTSANVFFFKTRSRRVPRTETTSF